MAEHNQTGKIGEAIACKYLESKRYLIIERNFRVRRGEIDIIATKDAKNFHVKPKKLVFIEVKTTKISSDKEVNDTSYSPEKRLNSNKKRSLLTAIKYYLSFRNIQESETEIEIMALVVYLNPKTKQAKIRTYENFVL